MKKNMEKQNNKLDVSGVKILTEGTPEQMRA